MIEPHDLAELERDRGLSALARVTLTEVRDPDDVEFIDAYEALDGFFGPRGELEDRRTLAEFLRQDRLVYGDDLEGRYHLVVARAGGRLVGVRDCYVDLDLRAGACVVALSHCYVAPAWRRSGLAAVLRAVPRALARRAAAARGGPPLPTLLVTEMEPADPARPDTIIRLLAYGRAGFGVLDPARARYSQVEFRDIPDAGHTAIPLLALARPLDPSTRTLPVSLVASFLRLFYTCHRGFVPAARVEPSESLACTSLHGTDAPVRLLPLPTGRDTLARLAPLVRGAVLPLYPAGLRGPDPTYGEAHQELARIFAAWGADA